MTREEFAAKWPGAKLEETWREDGSGDIAAFVSVRHAIGCTSHKHAERALDQLSDWIGRVVGAAFPDVSWLGQR